MAAINKITLIGRLTTDPEVKATTDGTSLAKFCIAVDRTFSKEDKTDFINIVSWRDLAEQAEKYFKKGMLVLIEGRIQNRTYENKDGETVWATEVVSNFSRILESKKNTSEAKEKNSDSDITEDDIPF